MAKEVAARYHDRSIWIVTSVGDEEYSPAIKRSKVDLPQPDGPRRARNSPASTCNETPAIASVGQGPGNMRRTASILTASELVGRGTADRIR